jgi:hypothetical protein
MQQSYLSKEAYEVSEPVWLISSYRVTSDELKEMIVQAGGVLTPERPYIGRVSHEKSHVWIYEPYNIDPNDPDMEENELQDMEVLRTLFGDDPRSGITLDVSFSPGSQKLAVAFARFCSRHWPCVVEAPDGSKFFTKEEILQLEQEGGGFSSYGL